MSDADARWLTRLAVPTAPEVAHASATNFRVVRDSTKVAQSRPWASEC